MRADACAAPVAVSSWGLSRIAERKMSLDGRYSADDTAGEGVIAYIVDTGIYVEHTEFAGRATFGFKATPSWSDTDRNGHGTHVAGTVVGARFGVARRATAVAVKVLGDDGSGTNAGVVSGVEWVVTQYSNHKKPSVINMSLGGGVSTVLNMAVNTAVDTGVAVVVAAGNSNNDACSGSPASATNVLTVGSTAVGLSNTDVRSYFSSFGSCVNIFGPGSDITSAWIGNPSATNTISGTSMASPHVAGVAVLLFGQDLTANAKDIQKATTSLGTQGVINLQCSTTACTLSPNLMIYNGCDKTQ